MALNIGEVADASAVGVDPGGHETPGPRVMLRPDSLLEAARTS
jgi:hypothetical protein